MFKQVALNSTIETLLNNFKTAAILLLLLSSNFFSQVLSHCLLVVKLTHLRIGDGHHPIRKAIKNIDIYKTDTNQ